VQTQEGRGYTVKPVVRFAFQLGAKIALNPDFVVEKAGRYFLLNDALQKIVRKDFYYAGTYLGKVKNGKFFPSFDLLSMLAKAEANKIVVEKKTAWLFICGRDVFRKGVVAVRGSRTKGSHTLVLNEFGECLGFGRIVRSLNEAANKSDVVVRNISDIGDFLRRES
jgi:ribosome biogenesis protein Nip4